MRTRNGGIKVLDFGLARMETAAGGIAASLTASIPGGVIGTPAYMSPEQIEGRTAGPASDVFAFGVLMYEWISGRHPFQAGSTLAMLARVLDSTPDPLSSHTQVPAWLSAVVDRCLRKPSTERFSSALELAQAFEHPAIVEAPAARSATWWRTHQIVAIVLYVIASAHAWQVKEWLRQPVSLWVFIAIGIAASVGGIIRGHLVFTDVLMALLLAADALLLIGPAPLTAVLTMALATGIALAAILMEPATTAALMER
jgi:hypothetical protein